jgi:prepilin-type N-terminal cleavage/methylation domain-containing protein/prepilin-type processing-associated H-X9-DG protein
MNRRAFTLIELLVVIAVIALLIGILLPSLSGARSAGRAVVCQAHERGVVLSMAAYENGNKGWLVGPNTSGSDLQQNRPYVTGTDTPCQDWDYASPLLGDSLGFPIDQLDKFREICMTHLRCPDNTVRYGLQFSGPTLPLGPTGGDFPFALSYLTPAYFQVYPMGVTSVGGRSVESLPSGEPVALPQGYVPRSDRVGFMPSKKIMAFEGARYWNSSINGFDFSTVLNTSGLTGTPQGNFNSRGSAFGGSGENYQRDAAGGYRPTPLLKRMSLRHALKMNAGMFDGHVETMDNVQSSDPSYYLPSRSRLLNPSTTWYYYLGPANSPLRQPNALIP